MKEARELKRYLKDLVDSVDAYLTELDVVMNRMQPNAERGKAIAELSNRLELAKDIAKRFGLGSNPAAPQPTQPDALGALERMRAERDQLVECLKSMLKISDHVQNTHWWEAEDDLGYKFIRDDARRLLASLASQAGRTATEADSASGEEENAK